MRYVVSVDLGLPRESAADYKSIGTGIETHYLDSFRMQKSVWLISTEKRASEIRETLFEYVKPPTTLFIVPINAWASYNLSSESTTWLANFK